MHAHRKISATRRLRFATALAAASGAFVSPVLAGGPPPAPVASWSGFYAGVHGGWGWGKTEFRDPININAFNPFFAYYSGPLAGGQFGYNWQQGSYVFGAEVDGSWSFTRGNTSSSTGVISSSTNNNVGYTGFATATGRLGYASGQWLGYAKGGAAWGHMELTARYTPDVTAYDRNLFGAVGGVGLEVAFLRNVSAKVEYNVIWFPTDHLTYLNYNTTTDLAHLVQLVKAGINVRFNGDGGLTR